MLTPTQVEHSHRLRRAVDHLIAVEQALNLFHASPTKESWKALGKAIAKGNKFPTSLALIGHKVVANAMRDGVVALRDQHADDLAKLHNSNK